MNITKIYSIRAFTISAAIVLSLNAASAFAATSQTQFGSDGVNKYVVHFPDLDLSKVDGAAALYGRLRHAAAKVCGSLESRDVEINTRYRTCVEQAVMNAVNSVGRPMLSQYHDAHTKGGKSALIQLARTK